MHRKTQFTLIELLVVIAVITIIMAILLPSLNRARGMAKMTQCASNMRGAGQAFLLYSADWNGWGPPLGDFQTQNHEVDIKAWFGSCYDRRNWTQKQANNLCPDVSEQLRQSPQYWGTLGGNPDWNNNSPYWLRLPWVSFFGSSRPGLVAWGKEWTTTWYGWNTYEFEVARNPVQPDRTPKIEWLGNQSFSATSIDGSSTKNVRMLPPGQAPMLAEQAFYTGKIGYWGYPMQHYPLGSNNLYMDGHIKTTPLGMIPDAIMKGRFSGNNYLVPTGASQGGSGYYFNY